MSDDLIDMVCRALGRAWGLGQTYWQQADSESYSQNRKSEETQRKFDALLEETRSALSQPAPQGVAEVMEAPEWAELYRLREAVKGPDGFATWQDAATNERIRRVKAEARIAELEGDVARDAARYRWLRDIGDETFVPMAKRPGCNVEMIDKAVDAAMGASKEAKRS